MIRPSRPPNRVGAAKRRSPEQAVVAKSFQVDGNYPHLNTRFNMRSVGITLQLQASAQFAATLTGSGIVVGKSYRLSDFTGYTSFTSVFERYRIRRIEVWLLPNTTEAPSGAPEGGTYVTGVDVDDGATPGSYGAVQRMQGACETSVMCGRYIAWSPQASVFTYPAATFGSAPQDQWLDCGSPGVEYYGLKFAAGPTNDVVGFATIIRITAEFQGIDCV